MNTYIDSRQITLSSDTAKSIKNGTYKSDCYFEFFGMLTDDDDILQSQISVATAQIPISYYVINQYNNRLFYQLGTNPIQSVEFTQGNYNSSSFIDEMKAKIPSISVVFNKITGKFIFAKTASFNFLWFGSSCFSVLGLDPLQDYNGLSSPYNLPAPYPCQFQGITRIKISSSEFSTYSMDSKAGGFSNTLASLAVNSSSYGILIYDNISGYKPTLRNKIINSFDIQLLDDNDNLINFNNIDWRMTLQLDITRQRKNYDKVFPRFSNKIDVPPEPQENNNLGNTDAQNIQETTGDTDLDLLLYQNGIYQ